MVPWGLSQNSFSRSGSFGLGPLHRACDTAQSVQTFGDMGWGQQGGGTDTAAMAQGKAQTKKAKSFVNVHVGRTPLPALVGCCACMSAPSPGPAVFSHRPER